MTEEKNEKTRITEQIQKGSEKSRKTFTFDEEHDENVPAQMWFQESNEGMILFVVFYTQACRWNRCIGCNLPSKCSQFHVSYKALINQIDWLFTQSEVIKKREKIKKFILSNNGSVLDQVTFSSTALIYLIAKLNLHFPNLGVLSMETRPEFVEIEELEFLSRALQEGETPTEMEFAAGFEIFDDEKRNKVFNKGLSLEVFEKFVSKVARYKEYKIKCYFMQKPVPGMTDEEAVQDIKNAIDYLSQVSRDSGVRINMHLNPTYAAYGTPLAEAFKEGRYSPPRLIDVAKSALHAKGKNLSIFLGLFDEGLAVEGGSFVRPGDEELVNQLEKFNRTQDFEILESILEDV